MTLSAALNDVDLELKCHKCNHAFVRKGSWVKVISSFKCENCGGRNRIGYPEKVGIFAKHAALLPKTQRRMAPDSSQPAAVGRPTSVGE